MIKISLTKSQWERLSEILGNLGLLSFASVALPYLWDKPNITVFVSGLLIAFVLCYASIIIARKY